jgi:hypothetical protein
MGNAVSTASAPAPAPQVQTAKPFSEQRSQSAGTEQRPSEPTWESALSDPIVFATLWLAVVTTALWFATYRMWKATGALAEDAKNATKAAEDAVAQAAEANRIAQEAVERQLRPWLVPHFEVAGTLEWGPDRKCSLDMKVMLKNVGKSPAVAAMVYGCLVRGGTTEPSPIDVQDYFRTVFLRNMNHGIGADIYPGGETIQRPTFATLPDGLIEKPGMIQLSPIEPDWIVFGVSVVGLVQYFAANDETPKFSGFVVHLSRRRDRGNNAFDIREGNVAPEDLEMDASGFYGAGYIS